MGRVLPVHGAQLLLAESGQGNGAGWNLGKQATFNVVRGGLRRALSGQCEARPCRAAPSDPSHMAYLLGASTRGAVSNCSLSSVCVWVGFSHFFGIFSSLKSFMGTSLTVQWLRLCT